MTDKDSGGQKREGRDRRDQDDEAAAPPAPAPEVQERVEKLGEDVDAILDEIDEVLEANAEDFVKSYIQKGGE